jgi:signal transduction histidine kinase
LGSPRESAGPTHVVVEFRDTGHGMTREQRQGAFTSLLSTSKRKGTGLGLAIVARVVEAHRGKVEVRSSSIRGTTIAVTLPL